MLDFMSKCVLWCVAIFKIFGISFQKTKKRESVKNAFDVAKTAIKNDKKLKRLYEKMVSLPKDGTLSRQNERSHVIRDILNVTQDMTTTKVICAMADLTSQKKNDESKTKNKVATG